MFYPRRALQPTSSFTGSSVPLYSNRVIENDYPSPQFPVPRYGPSHLSPYTDEAFDEQPRSLLGSRVDSPPNFDSGIRRHSSGTRSFGHPDLQDALFEADYPRPRFSQEMSIGGPPRFLPPADFPSLPRPRTFQPVSHTRPFQPILEKPRRVRLSQPSGDKVRRSLSSVYCDVCKIACGGPKALFEHQNGQRHKKRVSQAEAMERIKQSSENAEIVKITTTSNSRELRCELCNIGCTGAEAFSAHLVGKVHQRAVRLHRELGKPIPLVTQPPEETAVPEVIKITDDPDPEPVKIESPLANAEVIGTSTVPDATTTFQPVDATTDSKLVGADYVTEIPAPGGRGVHFRCNLCECQFTNKEAKEVHMRGRRHRLQYKKKVDPLFPIAPKPRKLTAKRKFQPGRRPEMSQLTIPPMPSPNLFASSGFLPFSESAPFYGFQAAFGRFPYRPHEPGCFPTQHSNQHPSVTMENRYLHTKHSSIVPTEIEAKAMKTVVNLCEHCLRCIGNELMQEMRSARRNSAAGVDGTKTSVGNQLTEGITILADSQGFEGDRPLRGIIRVGALGKSLLLRGDHEGTLVLNCSEWPTTKVVQFFQNELAKTLPLNNSNFSYTLCSSIDIGKITIVATKKQDGTIESTELTATDTWPVITVHIWFTSNVVRNSQSAVNGASGAVEADGSNTTASPALHTAPEQPSNSGITQSRSPERLPMFAQGERIDRRHCLDALDAIDQAKWFQSALVKYPLGIIARVLLDFMRANKPWLNLDQFSLFAFLDRLLSTEIQVALRMSGNPAFAGHSRPGMPPALVPFSPPIRGGAPSCQPSPPITPARLFRLFFESISSGILLILRTDEPDPKDGPESANNESTDELFFAFKRLAECPIDVREEITAFAQLCLRQIAFKQLYKVLRIEPLVHNAPRQKVATLPTTTASESEVIEDSTGGNDSSNGGVKRRRTDQEIDDGDDAGDADHTTDKEQDLSGVVVTEDADSNTIEPIEPNQASSVDLVPEASITSPTIRTRSVAKRQSC